MTEQHEQTTNASEAKNEEKNQRPVYILTIGFFGGLIASGLTYLAHFLNFIPYGPGVIWQNLPLYNQTKWMVGPSGHFLGMIVISILSILIAFLYYTFFRRLNHVWAGVWFGMALWVVIFLGINPLIPGTKTVQDLGWNTNITFFCIFIIYGLFVGYSISYEFNDTMSET